MTNNQLTDERIEQIAVWLATESHSLNLEMLTCLRELQERRKADSEPVGEFYEDGPLNWYQISDGDRVPAHRRIPLYRHAQPAPVVPAEKTMPNPLNMYAVDAVAAIAEVRGWNACRAAMLATVPQGVK